MRPNSIDPAASFRIAVSTGGTTGSQTVGSILVSLERDFRERLGCELETVLLLDTNSAIPDWVDQLDNASCKTVRKRWWHRFFAGVHPTRDTIAQLRPDVLLAIDGFVPGVDCPQIVFHSNTAGSKSSDANRLQALQQATANVFDSEALRQQLLDRYPVTRPDQYHVVHFNGQIRLSPHLLTAPPPQSSTAPPESIKDDQELHSTSVEPQIVVMLGGNPSDQLSWLSSLMNRLVRQVPAVGWTACVISDIADSQREQIEVGASWDLHWCAADESAVVNQQLEKSTCLIVCPADHAGVDHAFLAMQHRCPVVAWDGEQLQSRLQNAAVMCRADDLGGWVDAIATLFEDADVRRDFMEFGLAHCHQLESQHGSIAFSEILYGATGRTVT